MKARSTLVAVSLLFAATVICFAQDAQMGTWKLNEAKSKFAAGAPKNNTVIYETIGDQIKITVDGVDADGKPQHNEWTGKFDGKDYPVTGSPLSDTRSYNRVNANTLSLTEKKGGKVSVTGRVAVAPDGKSRTVTTTRTGAGGKKSTSTAVYDKQ